MSILTREDIIVKLMKRKQTLSNIVEDKRVSLVAYNEMVKGLVKPQQNISAKLQAKKDRFDEYEEHFILLTNDLASIDKKTDEEVQIIWDFYESFVQTSKSVKESLSRKQVQEEPDKKKRGRPKKPKAGTV